MLAKIYMENGMGKIPKAYLQKLIGGESGKKEQKNNKILQSNTQRNNNSLLIS